MKGKTKRLIAIAVAGIMLLAAFGSVAAFADDCSLSEVRKAGHNSGPDI